MENLSINIKPKHIGYKATYNMVSHNNFLYQVGKTYIHDGEIKPCNSGFHYCPVMKDVLNYYNPDNEFVLLEIEILSDNIVKDEDKSVTDKIKVLRIIPVEEHKLFTWENNKMYYKSKEGDEYWREYDSDGRLLHFKLKCFDGSNYESWREYTANGCQKYHKVIDDGRLSRESWQVYDPAGNEVKRFYKKEEYENFLNDCLKEMRECNK